jgi:Ion channel
LHDEAPLDNHVLHHGQRAVTSRAQRRNFVVGLLFGLRVVSPVLSGILVVIAALGVLAGVFEGWSVLDSIYFAFVSGLTIGYGDIAPKTLVGRMLAIAIGACGILLTGLVAAVAVKAITAVTSKDEDKDEA